MRATASVHLTRTSAENSRWPQLAAPGPGCASRSPPPTASRSATAAPGAPRKATGHAPAGGSHPASQHRGAPGAARPGEPDDHRRPPGGTDRRRPARQARHRGHSPGPTTQDHQAAPAAGPLPCPAAGSSPWPLSQFPTSTATTGTSRTPTSRTTPSATWSRSATRLHLPALLPPRERQRLRARRSLRQRRTDLRLQRRRPQPSLPPGKTVTRLERHPAQARLAPVDHPSRPHLHPGPQALPDLNRTRFSAGVSRVLSRTGAGRVRHRPRRVPVAAPPGGPVRSTSIVISQAVTLS